VAGEATVGKDRPNVSVEVDSILSKASRRDGEEAQYGKGSERSHRCALTIRKGEQEGHI